MAGSARHESWNIPNAVGSGEFLASSPSASLNSRRNICRGFFDAYRNRTRDLLILQAGRRLTEVPPPVVAKAEELGRDAGKAAASQVFDGSTPEEAYQRVLRGIDEGDAAVLDPIEPPAIGPAAGYTEDDLARDLGIEAGDRALPRAVPAYADAFTDSFWRETERAAREHAG